MDHRFRLARYADDFMKIKIRSNQIWRISFDLAPAEGCHISKAQAAADADRKQAAHQRRGILKNQPKFLLRENLTFRRSKFQWTNKVERIFFHGIPEIRQQKCEYGFAGHLIAVQRCGAQYAAELIRLEFLPLWTAGFFIADSSVPAPVFTDMG